MIGPVLAAVAARTGIGAAVPVYAGIHDSNASLYPHLVRRKAPFAVVSTGTWVVSMAIGGKAVALDPARDTLINVNASATRCRRRGSWAGASSRWWARA